MLVILKRCEQKLSWQKVCASVSRLRLGWIPCNISGVSSSNAKIFATNTGGLAFHFFNFFYIFLFVICVFVVREHAFSVFFSPD